MANPRAAEGEELGQLAAGGSFGRWFVTIAFGGGAVIGFYAHTSERWWQDINLMPTLAGGGGRFLPPH